MDSTSRPWPDGSRDWHEITGSSAQVVSGQTAYSLDWSITQPTGTGYRLSLRHRDESGPWLAYDETDGMFRAMESAPEARLLPISTKRTNSLT